MMQKEKAMKPIAGLPVVLVGLLLVGALVVGLISRLLHPGLGVVLLALVIFSGFGLFMVHPNQAKVIQLFGKYIGTAKEPGLRWANPFFTKLNVSTRIRNFETSKLKVNDQRGNPIEIAAVVVWKVVDTAEAVFEVNDFENFVRVRAKLPFEHWHASTHTTPMVRMKYHW